MNTTTAVSRTTISKKKNSVLSSNQAMAGTPRPSAIPTKQRRQAATWMPAVNSPQRQHRQHHEGTASPRPLHHVLHVRHEHEMPSRIRPPSPVKSLRTRSAPDGPGHASTARHRAATQTVEAKVGAGHDPIVRHRLPREVRIGDPEQGEPQHHRNTAATPASRCRVRAQGGSDEAVTAEFIFDHEMQAPSTMMPSSGARVGRRLSD